MSDLTTLRRELAECERVGDALSPGHYKNKYREQAKVLRAARLEEWKRMKHDLGFIAQMLNEVVIVQNYKSNFHVCEAWEVAKKYCLNTEKT